MESPFFCSFFSDDSHSLQSVADSCRGGKRGNQSEVLPVPDSTVSLRQFGFIASPKHTSIPVGHLTSQQGKLAFSNTNEMDLTQPALDKP